MVKKRRRRTADYKLRVALESHEGSKTISQLSSEHEIHANLIQVWKRKLLEDGPSFFASNGKRKQREQEAQEAELYEQIERLKMELKWLKKKNKLPASARERLRMVDADSTLSVRQHGALLGLNRSSLYYQAVPESVLKLQLMRLIYEQFLRTPFYNWRKMTVYLRSLQSLRVIWKFYEAEAQGVVADLRAIDNG